MNTTTERPTMVGIHRSLQLDAEGLPADTDRPDASELASLRAEIERLDGELVGLIKTRCELARNAGARKREAGLPLLDPAQEAAVVRRVAERARAAGLEEERVRQLFWCLLDLSRHVQSGEGT